MINTMSSSLIIFPKCHLWPHEALGVHLVINHNISFVPPQNFIYYISFALALFVFKNIFTLFRCSWDTFTNSVSNSRSWSGAGMYTKIKVTWSLQLEKLPLDISPRSGYRLKPTAPHLEVFGGKWIYFILRQWRIPRKQCLPHNQSTKESEGNIVLGLRSPQNLGLS